MFMLLAIKMRNNTIGISYGSIRLRQKEKVSFTQMHLERKKLCLFPCCEAPQFPHRTCNRQADHIKIIAPNFLHQRAASPLDAISAGFVH